MQTVRPDSARECITPNKALTGWAQADKDLTFQKVNIENKEGPQARPYTPKYDPPGADVIQFPSIEPETERKYECRQRRMDMLIYTEGLFKERYPAFGDKGGFPFEDDGEPYPNTSTLPISPKSSASKFLSEIRLELESFEVPENRIMKGRICFDLMEPITVDSIEFDINKTLVMVTKDGKVITPRKDASASVTKLKLLPSRQPKPYIPELATPEEIDENEGKTRPPYDFVLPNTYRKTVGLNLDRKCIPFEIYIPENIVPSFSYVAPNGGSVVNNYSVEATVRTCGSTERVGLVPITVPALGKESDPGYGLGDDLEVVMPNRCFTNQEGFDYAVGWIDGDANTPKPKSISAKVIQIVKCSAIGADSSVTHELGSVNMASGDSNSVFDQYKLNPKSKTAKDNWGANASSQDNTTQFTTPSVSTEGFTCDYILEVEADSKTFSGAVILCDRLSKNDLQRNDLSPISRRNDFRLKR
uniref:Ig-like domain-containing protein n=2 Tax=Mesocestoides corti TaxID=53468 RepID=A0A5K3FM66_MESCO